MRAWSDMPAFIVVQSGTPMKRMPLLLRGLLHLVSITLGYLALRNGGGAVGPVASGGVHPTNSGVHGDAEHVGENRGRDFSGELKECSTSGCPGVHSVWAESFTEAARGDGLSRKQTREQPLRGRCPPMPTWCPRPDATREASKPANGSGAVSS